MNLIQWHDSFSVGVQLIDNQHQQLFALVNDLIMAINQNQEDALLEDLLHSVFAYTEMHFKAEEELFKIHPQFNGHREVHQKFVATVSGAAKRIRKNDTEVAVELLGELTDWLKNHILKTDIMFFSELGYRPKETREDFEARLQVLVQKDMVLVVDDAQLQRKLLRRHLEIDGFEVLEACNGSEALKIIETTPDLHLIVTDIDMPEMNGYQLIEAIRDKPHLALYIIVITALTDEKTPVTSLRLGANDFLIKPIRPQELCLRLRNGLHVIRLESQDELIFSMAKLADHRSPETGKHLDRVQNFTRLLGRQLIKSHPQLGMTESIAADISRFSPLHDIGKVAIPDYILKKEGKLTPEEFVIMQDHARVGGELISTILRKTASRSLRLAYELTMYHHEKWDGSGYPIGLAGTDIPISARIMALADVYDALTSERVYKKAFPREKANAILLSSAGSHFDPIVVEAFAVLEEKFHELRERLRD